jgi:DNA-binding LytR/AlgR family response regulator
LANSTDFVRIHKRHIINLRYASSITKARSGGFVCLCDGRKLAIARRRARVMKTVQL